MTIIPSLSHPAKTGDSGHLPYRGSNPTQPDEVTVIVPAHNAERYIRETLTSVCAAQGVAKVIVVLDRCTDRTSEIVAEFASSLPSVVAMVSPGGGVSAARNAGAGAAETEFLMFVDADDIVTAEGPSHLAALLRARPDCVVAYGEHRRIASDGSAWGARALAFRSRADGDVFGRLLECNLIATPGCALIRREAFREAGGFPAGITHGEDWHLWLRLAAVGHFAHGKVHVLDYRTHEGSATLNGPLSPTRYMQAVDAIFDDPMIVERGKSLRLEHMKRSAMAHVLTYLACQAIRRGHVTAAVSWWLKSARLFPARAPRRAVQVASAALRF